MKNKRILYGLIFMMGFLFITMITTTSCKDDDDQTTVEKVKGCTDPNSLTYNSAAEEDDGSCVQAEVKERAILLDFTATW